MNKSLRITRDSTRTATRRLVIDAIWRTQHALVLSHRDPDADSLGSALALGEALENRGAQATVAIDSPELIAPPLDDLLDVNRVLPLTVELADGQYDTVFVVDTASPALLGAESSLCEAAFRDRTVVNVDHHASNRRYGTINYVEDKAAATAEVLWMVFSDAGISCTEKMAVNLQTGLVGDTIGFQIADTSARTLRAAASLMESGGLTHGTPRRVLNARTIIAARLYGAALAEVQSTADGRIVWTSVTHDLVATVNARVEYSHGLPNALQEIVGAEIGAVFYEIGASTTRGSLRSTSYAINGVAERFGGGGHQLAAGFTIDQPIAVARRVVLDQLEKLLDG